MARAIDRSSKSGNGCVQCVQSAESIHWAAQPGNNTLTSRWPVPCRRGPAFLVSLFVHGAARIPMSGATPARANSSLAERDHGALAATCATHDPALAPLGERDFSAIAGLLESHPFELAVTSLANFLLRRNQQFSNHFHSTTAPFPVIAVRFDPTETDNQSAGELRLGFQPFAVVLGCGLYTRLAL